MGGPVDIPQTLRDLKDRLDAYSRRFEACEDRHTHVPAFDAYWTTRCKVLERELRGTNHPVVQLQEGPQHERVLVEHLRWRMDYRQSRYALMMAELEHENCSTNPFKDLAAPPRPRRLSAKTTAKVPKAAKSSNISTSASSAPKSGTPRGLPLVPSPNPDDDNASNDSEVVRATLARSRSFRRRTTPNDPPLPAVSADSVTRPVNIPGPELFRAMFGSSDSEIESVTGEKAPRPSHQGGLRPRRVTYNSEG
ncbi:unnamed protein product [Peronospora belbahrii]|uniref:Uncharacterized protein n=1 Tax=Peronospora belbahrii TaxID=622444 RepID=A0AAU9LN49_9STRA|nr:unnamed protein product [Peronospora belbahrii]